MRRHLCRVSYEVPSGLMVVEVERTGQLVQKPVRGRAEALLVLLWSTTHFDCCVRLVVEVVGGPVEAMFGGLP